MCFVKSIKDICSIVINFVFVIYKYWENFLYIEVRYLNKRIFMILWLVVVCMLFVVVCKCEVKYFYYVIFMVIKIFLFGICIFYNGSMVNKVFFFFSL